MSPTCPDCHGLVADARGIVEYSGNTFPALCYCPPVAELADFRAQHDLDQQRIKHLETQLDICATAAVHSIRAQQFLQNEIERLDQIITAMTSGSLGNN